MKVYKTREGYKATMKSGAIFYNVLIPCDYEELQRLRTIATKYDRIKVNGNYPDKISKLKSRIKHLLELQANQDNEVERLKEENEELMQDNYNLCQLLKDCYTIIDMRKVLVREKYITEGLEKYKSEADLLESFLTKISEALNV